MKKLSTLIAFLLVFSMVGCSNFGKVNINPTPAETISEDTSSLDIKELKLNIEDEFASNFKYSAGYLYYIVQYKETNKIVSIDISTGENNTINLPNIDNYSYTEYNVTSDNSVWVLSSPLRGNDVSKIYKYDTNGTEELSYEVKSSPSSMVVSDNSTVFLAYENALQGKQNEFILYDETGKAINTIPTYSWPSFLKTSDGFIHTISYENDNVVVQKINAETNEIENSELQNAILENGINFLIEGNSKFAFFSINNEGIVGYNTQTKNIELVIDYNTENISIDNLCTILPLNNQIMAIVLYGENNQPPTIKTVAI